MKTFVMADIHGAFRALNQCFERSGFNKAEDKLIVLGDVCDGWPDVQECVQELINLKHCVYILGNHDQWAINWATKGFHDDIWLSQGGRNTIRSYAGRMPAGHLSFLTNAKPFWEEKRRLFVHGGFDPEAPIAIQDPQLLIWDRNFLVKAFQQNQKDPRYKFGGYDEVFIGHTPTLRLRVVEPVKLCNVWVMDTGAGWSGRLTIMNVDTKEFWQSDDVPGLYPEDKGRRG